MMNQKLKGAFPIVFITIVVFVSVALVTWTYSITEDRIEYQKEQEIQQMLEDMFPDMSSFDLADSLYTIYSDGSVIGYAFLTVGKGYGGDIDILVGLEDEETIRGINIVAQTETPGLGNLITKNAFTSQFAGIKIDDITLKQDGGQIDAITGATISSLAVIETVRNAAIEKVKLLKERAGDE